ncbi:serine/threonine/tyrosine-interacting-like protein 1 [Notolabrus celidotus]|uniref:serine/threonine/tyrosine-interacting-like protein 1 n=1 Tax=Notolabrus celidotus TaxID=1203425 RepID=UPI0014902523|nr:serine/threonine/tyrosine-interacting-like protein 1 [Notolabrus celidotus]
MAEVILCEPLELYNLLNQSRCVSRLAEINYLCLIDAREVRDYRVSHIVTARNAKVDSEDSFLLPEAIEVDSMQHVVVYDGNTSCLEEQGRAVQCAQMFTKASLHPVKIVRGGFQRFSAMYNFLRTDKILYTVMELENLKTYPVEIIAGLLYMGDLHQSMDSSTLRDLKINAVISISESDTLKSRSIKGIQTILNIPVEDSGVSDLYSSFEKICSFIDSHINIGSRVLIVSRQGRSRCSAVTIAFLMHHLKYTLEEAWRFVLKCKPNMRPNTGFIRQLSDWELHTRGTKVTKTSEALL